MTQKKTFRNHTRASGFSLIEMMLVLVILSIVMGVTMTAINDVQKRARVEEARVDLNQEAREFVEQMVRDLHAAGYPTPAMFATPPANTSIQYAAGLVDAQPTSIWFEGDLNGNGYVDVVRYQLVSDPNNAVGGRCPCILQRGQAPKVAGTAPNAQPAPTFSTEVDGVINSGGGAAALVIDGSFLAKGSSTITIANDVYYSRFKQDPIFRYYNNAGMELVPPIADLTQVRAIRITANTMSRVVDPITGTYPVNTQKSTARISNR